MKGEGPRRSGLFDAYGRKKRDTKGAHHLPEPPDQGICGAGAVALALAALAVLMGLRRRGS